MRSARTTPGVGEAAPEAMATEADAGGREQGAGAGAREVQQVSILTSTASTRRTGSSGRIVGLYDASDGICSR